MDRIRAVADIADRHDDTHGEGVGMAEALRIADRVEGFVRDVVVPYERDPRRDDHGSPTALRVFRPAPDQGVNIAMNTWHGVLTVLDRPARFLVVDRGGDGVNLEEHHFAEPWLVKA